MRRKINNNSNKTYFVRMFILVLILSLSVVFVSCSNGQNRSGQTIDEPDVTLEYLQGEYAAQLLRDGAQVVTGSIESVSENSGNYTLTINEKEISETNDIERYPEGFYIADKNNTVVATFDQYTRSAFIPGNSSVATVLAPDEFWDSYKKDLADHSSDENYAKNKLYDIYIMGEQIVLMMSHYHTLL